MNCVNVEKGHRVKSKSFRKFASISTASVTVLAIGAVGVVVASPASADVETRGNCTMESQWEADIEREFNVYGIDFEVKTQKADENWRLTLTQNGKRVYTNTRATFMELDDRYADVDWEIIRPDRKGVTDRFTVTATNAVTGEVCKTTLRG